MRTIQPILVLEKLIEPTFFYLDAPPKWLSLAAVLGS